MRTCGYLASPEVEIHAIAAVGEVRDRPAIRAHAGKVVGIARVVSESLQLSVPFGTAVEVDQVKLVELVANSVDCYYRPTLTRHVGGRADGLGQVSDRPQRRAGGELVELLGTREVAQDEEVIAPVVRANVDQHSPGRPEQCMQGWGHSHVRPFMVTSGPFVHLGHVLPVDVVMPFDDDRCLPGFR